MATIGQYRIKRQISEGGFGRVYEAEHIFLGEKACIKQNKEETKEAIELLRHEAKLLWKLDNHHSIPSIKDFFHIDKQNAVIVTSYIEGETLHDLISNNSRLHPEEACWITERLLHALQYCHYYGVVHSDIKPENVFAEPDKRDIKLIDFGAASFRPRYRDTPLGYTPLYAAPELMNGLTPVPETDLFGAGIILLYSLGGNVEAKTLPADVPKDLGDYCMKLLRHDIHQRMAWTDKPIESLSDLRLKLFGRRHAR